MNELREFRASLPSRTKHIIEVVGFVVMVGVWYSVSAAGLVPPSILPSPLAVLMSFGELHFDNALVANTGYSIRINVLGYLEAIAISLPFGFAIGLLPICRALTERYLTAFRYIPLNAVIGVFIAWFGIGSTMKVHFLAVSIVVYLLPTVVQRIDEVNEVYLQVVKTSGGKRAALLRHVFVPDVVSRVFDDVRVLVAISWTYIIIAEMVNMSDGGIGALAYAAARQSRIDKMFALLIVIMAVGFVQDRIFLFCDRALFAHKYVRKGA